jgi:RNA polymerase sigma factor (sigma-70 family)
MMTDDDAELLRQYAEAGTEDAFAELVRRHLPLVYSAALRQVGGDAELAKDIAQSVFLDLARKARSLRGHELLVGWLYTSTRFAAAAARRRDQRRRVRERIAVAMQPDTPTPGPDPSTVALGPALDEAMAELGAEDRHAVLLRFFQGKGLKEMGLALGVSEDAARMRVHRALEKLHLLLTNRGITLSAGALASVLAAQAVKAAPAGLAAVVSGAALAGATAGGQSASTLLTFLSMANLKTGLLGAVVVAGLATSAVIVVHERAQSRRQAETRQQQAEQLARLSEEHERLAGLAAAATNSPARQQLAELPTLRAEAERLRQKSNELAENRRLAQARAGAGGAQTELQERERGVARMLEVRDYLLAAIMYAGDHQNQLPGSFPAMAYYLSDRQPTEGWLTTNGFEMVYQGALAGLTNPANQILIREKEPWPTRDGGWVRAYGFLDGHSEIHRESDGNFEPWEIKHGLAPGSQ